MSRAIVGSHLTMIGVCLIAGHIASTPLGAETTPYATYGPSAPNAEVDSMVVIVELRAIEEIEFDLDVAKTKRAGAEKREAAARILQSRAETRIKVKETDITALEALIDQAKAEDAGASKYELEGKRDVAKVERELLKQREELRQRDIGFAKAEVEYQAAQMKAYALERDLARAREQWTSLANGGSDPAWKIDQGIREIEGETLDAQGEAAEKQKKLAEAAVKISKARKSVWEARQELMKSVGQIG